jgi:hypothetical protein
LTRGAVGTLGTVRALVAFLALWTLGAFTTWLTRLA